MGKTFLWDMEGGKNFFQTYIFYLNICTLKTILMSTKPFWITSKLLNKFFSVYSNQDCVIKLDDDCKIIGYIVIKKNYNKFVRYISPI